ncbi:cytochrome c5 family protein [Chitinimonas sp. BJYL2]|uniref:c-type cytochrome n=1 Tax=Chitinimonas sp. BJYL2 TaxID=2976696 RepID=UPI0022B4F72E|nr:c-type cytochrome [Chitinimonas sp. BJYL2]
MSEAQAESTMSAKTLIAVVVATIVGIPLFIYLIIKLATGGLQVDPQGPTMTETAVAARIQPVGESKLDESGPPGSRSGKAVYDAVCASCHAAGLAGAPKFGDTAGWAARLSKGFSSMVNNAIKGINGMPAKGGAADLTDDEVARAVAYMGNAAGGKFTEPAIQGAPAAATDAAAPVADAAAAAPAKVDLAAKGKEIYNSVCMACHAAGVAGAPKVGDKAAWAPRIKGGLDAVVKTAAAGKGAMPPKGGFAGSDEEFRATVEYMVNASK